MALTQEEINRIKLENEEKVRRSNCKQHCTKISEKLDKLPRNASSRAILGVGAECSRLVGKFRKRFS